jgi:hypothetical protein
MAVSPPPPAVVVRLLPLSDGGCIGADHPD